MMMTMMVIDGNDHDDGNADVADYDYSDNEGGGGDDDNDDDDDVVENLTFVG